MASLDPAQLATLPLFGGLPQHGLKRFAESVKVRELEAGEKVYQEGDPARELYVVADGQLRAFREKDETEATLAELKTGDFFGDMSFVDMQPRSATVAATTPARLWVWSYSTLRDAYVADIRCYTLLVMNIARELSRRLRKSDEGTLKGAALISPTALHS